MQDSARWEGCEVGDVVEDSAEDVVVCQFEQGTGSYCKSEPIPGQGRVCIGQMTYGQMYIRIWLTM